MNLATIIVLALVGAGAYWSIKTLRRTGGRRCGGCCDGCSSSHCTTQHDHAKSHDRPCCHHQSQATAKGS